MTTETSNRNLTAKQRKILRFIAWRILKGRPPTIRDVGKQFSINSPNGVLCHLRALEQKGFIEYSRLTARGICLKGGTLKLEYDDSEAGRRLQAELEHGAEEEQEVPLEGFP